MEDPYKGIKAWDATLHLFLAKICFLKLSISRGEKTTAYLQWKDFEKAEYLDDVPILIETTEVNEQHGTRLTIDNV